MARDYRREYVTYQGRPEQIKNRAQRNAAHRDMVKRVGKAAVQGKDVHHKRPIKSGGSNTRSNLALLSPSTNRSKK